MKIEKFRDIQARLGNSNTGIYRLKFGKYRLVDLRLINTDKWHEEWEICA
jgi:mRNA-degrading endonuclease RelE of RelBE toxin-antitoxin system